MSNFSANRIAMDVLSLKYFCALLAVLVLFVSPQIAYSQDDESAELPEIDSILSIIRLQNNDEEIAKLYNSIVHLPTASANIRIKYAQLSLEHCPEKNLELIADNYNFISYSYNNLGNPLKSLEYTRPLLGFYKKLKNLPRVAIAYSRMADNFSYLSLPDSIFHYLNKSLQIYESLNDTASVANCYFEIAVANENLSFSNTAIEYFFKALQMDSTIGNQVGVARDYYGIGATIIHEYLTDSVSIQSALEYLKKAADGFENAGIDENDIQNIVYKNMAFNDLACAYIECAEFCGSAYADSCRLYLDKIGSFFDDFGFEGMVWQKKYNWVKFLTFNGNYGEALKIMLDLEARIENGELDREKIGFYEVLSNLFIKCGDYRNAYAAICKHYQRKLIEINDSALTSAANAKTEQALMYERKITAAEKSRLRVVIFSLIGGLLLVSLLVFYVFRVLNIKKKANAVLSEKNVLLAEKNTLLAEQKEEITAQRDTIKAQSDAINASISYARRIQRSLLTPAETISGIFPDHFLLYKPRDIVSGDYYWVGQFGDNKVCIVADCTGHGVPGGFLSVLGMSNLNHIVGHDVSPDMILNHLREAIITNLRQSADSLTALQDIGEEASVLEHSTDGMDATVYVVNERQMKLSFAGANNSLVLIHNNEIRLLKADRMPVGIYARMEPFGCTTVDIEHGDCIYTYSDGFQDQFGDGTDRKFMGSRLRNLLLEIHQRPMSEQKELLNVVFEEWRGPASNQTDDVVIMGVRI